MKKVRKWERKISQKYELRYLIASVRNKNSGYTLIPESNRVAEAQHMSEHEAFQAIQRHALKGESEEGHKLLLELP
ncbi:MAG: hypothetical protein OSB08_01215 [SAR324 cluster bacterium]|nr:hypothetical protein [SAR324 cluster bacterium]